MDKKSHETNRISWNEATKAHNSHKGDQAKFFREGGNTLFPEEAHLLGDLTGKTVLHLQCNAGQDTLSIAKHHNATVTGVDISDEAIDFAKKLALDSGIPAEFIRADVYDFLAQNTREFDVIFMSYGTFIWLSNLELWAQGMAKALKSGGRFVFVDFHPIFHCFESHENGWTWDYSYGTGEPMYFENGIGDYVAMSGEALTHGYEYLEGVKDFVNPHASVEYNWGMNHIIGALAKAKLAITHFEEYTYNNGFRAFPDMVELEGRRFTTPEGMPKVPLMFSIEATKF